MKFVEYFENWLQGPRSHPQNKVLGLNNTYLIKNWLCGLKVIQILAFWLFGGTS